MQDCLKLLHFHLGSQITNIRIVKGALNEAARVYTQIAKLGAGLQYLDVGGGLGGRAGGFGFFPATSGAWISGPVSGAGTSSAPPSPGKGSTSSIT